MDRQTQASREERTMPTFTAKRSIGIILLRILMCTPFVLGGLFLVSLLGDAPDGGDPGAWLAALMGGLTLLLFGSMTVFYMMLLPDMRDQVRISSEGIFSRGWSTDTIPWSEIKGVHVWEQGRHKFIGLYLRDPAKFPPSTIVGKLLGPPGKPFGSPDKYMADVGDDRADLGDVGIYLGHTDGKFDDAMKAIAYFRDAVSR